MTEVVELARAARVAARQLAVIDRAHKDAALHAMADALAVAADEVLAANASDVARARAAGTSEALIDRLSLTQPRIDSMVAGLRSLASLPDPIGEVV
ncbi:MAG: glutamate-5-semialdehyde dehydrogenase, partial [Brooklawnia sp.]